MYGTDRDDRVQCSKIRTSELHASSFEVSPRDNDDNQNSVPPYSYYDLAALHKYNLYFHTLTEGKPRIDYSTIIPRNLGNLS